MQKLKEWIMILQEKKIPYSSIISDFERGVIDILIGTQMVTKGLDFDNVSLVGVLNVDTMLKFPNFRSLERALSIDESGKELEDLAEKKPEEKL